MRTFNAILLAIIATALMAAVPAAFEQADADIASEGGLVIVKGDTVLDGDLRLESGSDILILDGASVDIRDHTLEIGQGSKMAAIGSATITSSGGSVVFEGGRPLSIGAITLPKTTEDVIITFEGVIGLEFKPLSGTLSLDFEPSGSDRGVHATYGDAALDLEDPCVVVKIGLGSVDVKAGFSEMTLARDKYDGNKPVSSSAMTVVSGDQKDALDLAFYLKNEGQGHVYLKDMNISSVKTSTSYWESGLVKSSVWSGFGRLNTSLDDDGVLDVSSHIDRIIFERLLDDAVQSRTSVSGVDWSLALDLKVLFKILDSEITGGSKPDASDLVEEIDVTVDSIKVEDLIEGTAKDVSDASIVMKRDNPASYRLTIQWTDENGSYKITSSKLVINSFGLSSSLLMDLDVSVSHMKVEVEPFDGTPSSMEASDLELEVDNLDLKGLYDVASRTGTIDVQQLLDRCQRFHSHISSAVYAKDGREMAVKGLDVVLEEDGRRMNALTLGIESLKGTMAFNDGTLKADVGNTMAYLSTDGSLAEYIEALGSDPMITTDSEMTMQMRTEDVDIDYDGTDGSLSVTGKKISSDAPAMELNLSVRHTIYRDSTLLNGDFSASGYEISIKKRDYGAGSSLIVSLSSPKTTLVGMDLAKVREKGEQKSPVDIADETNKIVVLAESAALGYDDIHATVEDLRVESNSAFRHEVSIDSKRMDIEIPAGDGNIETKAESASLSLSSNLSFKKLQEAYENGFEFDSDADIDFEARLTGANLDCVYSDTSVVISGDESSVLSAEIAFEHSERWKKTVLNAELSAPGYKLSAKNVTNNMEMSASDPELELEDVDVEAIRPVLESGDLDIRTVLDNVKAIDVKASSVEFGHDGLKVGLSSAIIRTNSSGRYTASVDCEAFSAHVPSDDGALDVEAGAASARFTSDSSFSTVLHAFENGLKFESDTKMTLEAEITGLKAVYAAEKASLSIAEIREDGSATIDLDATLSHSETSSKTLLNLELAADGYDVGLQGKGSGDEPGINVKASDPHIQVSEADLDAIVSYYDEKGTLAPEMLDACRSLAASASKLSLIKDDGAIDLKADKPDLEIRTNPESTLRFDSGHISLSADVEGGDLDLEAASVKANFVSDAPFSEIMDIVDSELKFESDVQMDAKASLTGAAVSYSGDPLSLSLKENIGEGISVATLETALKHMESDSKTILDLKLDAKGYALTLKASDAEEDTGLNLKATDPCVEISEADMEAVISAYKEKRTFTLGMLDSCKSLRVSATDLGVLTAGTKYIRLDARNLSLETGSYPESTLRLVSDRLSVSAPADGGRIVLETASAKASLSSNLTFEELQEAYENGFRFDFDVSIDLTVELVGAEIGYAAGTTDVKISGDGPSILSAEISFEHSEKWSESVLNASLSAIGFETSATAVTDDGKKVKAYVSDPKLKLEGVDVDAVRPMLESKDFDIATLLDNTESMTAKASSAEFGRGDLRIELTSTHMITGSSGRYTASMECGSFSAHVPSDDGMFDAGAGTVSARLTSGASFSDLSAIFKDGLELEYDAKVSFEANIEGLEATYSGKSASLSISDSGQRSPVTIAASLSYYKESSKTLLDLNARAEGHVMTLEAAGADGNLGLIASGPSLNVSEADLDAIVSAYDEEGVFMPGMLDLCESLKFTSKNLNIEMSGDRDLALDAENPALEIDTVPSTLHFDSGRLSLSADMEDGRLVLEAVSVKADFLSDASFSEIADIIKNDLKFESDVNMEIKAILTGAVMSYSSGSVSLSLAEIDGPGTSAATLEASLQNIEAVSKTLLDLDAGADGYILEFESHGLHYGKLPFKGDDLHLMAVGPALGIKGLEISDLMQIRDEGGVSIQQVLDHCDSIGLSLMHAEVEWDGDGEADAILDDAGASLSRNVDGLAVIAFVVGKTKVSAPLKDMMIDVRTASTELSLSSDVKFSEMVDLVLNGMKFEKDADVKLSLKIIWLDLGLVKDNGSYSLSIAPRENLIGSPVRLDLDLIHSSYNDVTTVSGRLDASGYTTVVEADVGEESSGRLLSIPYSTSKSSQLKAVLDDLSSDVSRFDAGTAYDIIEKEGTLTIQQLLDCGDSMDVGASYASLDIDNDGEYEILVSGLSAALSKSMVGQNVMSLKFDEMTTSVDLKRGTVDIRSGASEIIMVSEGSLTECIDAFLYGVNFSKETHAEVSLSNESVLLQYGKEKEFISLTNERMSETSPKYVNVVLSVGYSKYKDVTSLVGKVTGIGHSLVLTDKTVVNDEGGVVLLVCSTDEVSGGFEADFGKEVDFSMNLFMPWTMSFEYYDIEFKMANDDSLVSLTNGILDVEGYDPKEQGILAIVPAIKNDDFSAEARLLMSSGSMTLYGKDETAVLDSYGDSEIDIKKISVDLERGEALEVQLEKIRLSVTDQDGKVTERSLDRLDVTKDQTGTVPEKGWVERNALALAIVFIAASIVMAAFLALRHKASKKEPEE